MSASPTASGLSLLESEMSRQHGDALTSFERGCAIAQRIAESLGRTGRLLLVGMGGSHHVNRTVEPAYRARGIDATALIASDLLAAPMPDRPRTAILTSQSGASGEILRLLAVPPGREDRFGLTLEASSPLAQQLPSLIGAGGTERAFAATRSLMISLALHATVLACLGEAQDEALQCLRRPVLRPVAAGVTALAGRRAVIVSGRGAMAGLAEAGALSLMELARLPVLGLEAGQFRHGPLEILSPEIGVVLLRGAAEAPRLTSRLVEACLSAGTSPVVFDLSGEAPPEGAINIVFPRLAGVAAAFALLPSLQRLMIDLAARSVDRVGEPIRSTKVTGE